MSITIAAIYENGVLRPRQPLELAEGTEVRLTISAPVGRRQPEVERSLDAEIERLAALKPNWDGYGGPAINDDILDAARRFAARLAAHIVEPPLVVPMSSGALQFEWHKGRRILELEVEDPVTIHYLKWDPTEGVQEEDVFGIDDTEKAVALIGWFTGAGANV
ncbi:MAG TPA: antitoxin family protein [Pirellulales bacterium]|nr:antitoxin family protein [Pirellulales bacterium]